MNDGNDGIMSIAFELSEAKKADGATKLLIFGFLCNTMNTHQLSTNIPDLVCFMVIIYFMQREYFDKAGKDIQISDDKLSITRISGYNYFSTTYCKQWISSTSNIIVTWKFKYDTMDTYGKAVIGLVTNDDCYDKDFSDPNIANVYALANHGWLNRDNDGNKSMMVNGIGFTRNDEFSFTLDLPNREIILEVNGKERKVIWSNILIGDDIRYRFAICLKKEKSKMSLIGFEIKKQ